MISHRSLYVALLLVLACVLVLVVILPVSAAAPVANFTGTPTSGTVPLSVQFTDTTPYNLLKFSEQFNNTGYWGATRLTVGVDFAPVPMDGTTTGDRLIVDGSTNDHSIITNSNLNLAASTEYIFSVYSKASELKWLRLRAQTKSGSLSHAYFNVSGGYAGTAINSTGYIEDVGDAWYRCSMIFNSGTGATETYTSIYLASEDNNEVVVGDSAAGVYIWGAQLKVKPAVNNLFSYTENFDNSYWRYFKTTVSPDVTTAPDGTTTADKLIEDNVASGIPGSEDHDIAKYLGLTEKTNYTFSVYAKPAGRNWVDLVAYGKNDTWRNQYFDLSTGTLGSQTGNGPTLTPAITSAGDGWYRCAITFNTTTGAVIPQRLLILISQGDIAGQYLGDGVSGLYLWGAQLEEGSSVSAYSPSTSDNNKYQATTVAAIPNITSWLWDFGDGTTSTSQNPLKTYNVGGLLNVNLTATNADGSDSENKTGYIDIPPVAAFGAVADGATVTFTDSSTGTPTSWSWAYNNHATPGWTQFSTARNPTYTFPTGGYDINLTATNAAGSDSEIKNSYVTISSGWETPVAGSPRPVVGNVDTQIFTGMMMLLLLPLVLVAGFVLLVLNGKGRSVDPSLLLMGVVAIVLVIVVFWIVFAVNGNG